VPLTPDVIEGGFTSRVLFIVSEEPKRRQAWPEKLDDSIKDRIETHLRTIRDRALSVSKIEISPGGRKAFDAWYRKRQVYRDPFRSSFQSREDAHILRLAAFLCINENLYVIQQPHILTAIKVITQVREDGASIFEGTGNSSRLILGIDKIRDKLLAAGRDGLYQRELTKSIAPFMQAEHLNACLAIMHELDMVAKFETVQVGRGRPSTLWRAGPELAQPKALEKVANSFAPTRS
jgi:hypothetical protein